MSISMHTWPYFRKVEWALVSGGGNFLEFRPAPDVGAVVDLDAIGF
jgi:hypothetical protein